jgi:hypothetical protein
MKALETGTTLATVVAATSVFFVLATLTAAAVVAGAAGFNCW